MKRGTLRLLTLFGLLLINAVAFADNSTASAVSNHTDLSVAYLSQVFGTVGDSLQGTSGQMLGHLFYKFNQGVLVVAGIWLSYLVFTMFLRSAHEGSFISPNRNIVIILLRVALGFGLLLPNPATGYSIFQDILMKVVVGGVSLADDTWSYGLKYIQNGGQVWTAPQAPNTQAVISQSDFDSIVGKSYWGNPIPTYAQLKPVQQIYVNEVCMAAANNYNSSKNYPAASVSYDPKTYTFTFPGVTSPTGGSIATNNCGTLTLPMAVANGSTASQEQMLTEQYATQAMIDALEPSAQKFASFYTTSGSMQPMIPATMKTEAGEGFYSSLLNFYNIVRPLTVNVQSASAAAQRSFIAQADQQGWMMAGRYYWDLSQVQNNYYQAASVASYVPTATAPGLLTTSPPDPNITKALNDTLASIAGYTSTASTILSNYNSASGAGNANGYNGSGDPGSNMGAMAMLMFPYIIALGHLYNTFSQGAAINYDPIVLLHNIGMQCISIAGAIWFTTSIIITVFSALTVFCQSYVNISTIFNNIVGWTKPLLMGIAGAMLTVGVLLGYYVPLYPFMLFTFGVIGWMIRVLIGMAAAPLVCLSLTHPEGHDFLGVAQQALMLLLGVFIEPVLMVIGLFAGMILSYVSFRIIIYAFVGVLGDLFAATPGQSSNGLVGAAMNAYYNFHSNGALMSGLTVPVLLIIFAAIVYTVTNKCFSTIFELPNAVMQWIGAPAVQNTAGQMAQTVQGATSQAASGFSNAMTGTGNVQAVTRERKEKSGNSVNVSPGK